MASGCTSESCHALQEGRGPLSPRSQWCWGGTEDVAFRRERTPVGSAAHPVTHFPHGPSTRYQGQERRGPCRQKLVSSKLPPRLPAVQFPVCPGDS